MSNLLTVIKPIDSPTDRVREGRGFLRAADDPGPKTSKDRDYRGTCRIGGVKYWINGWNDTRNPDDPYVALSFRRADEPRGSPLAADTTGDEE